MRKKAAEQVGQHDSEQELIRYQLRGGDMLNSIRFGLVWFGLAESAESRRWQYKGHAADA
ncbi:MULTISPECIES: hypothetical protein [Marinomonas]|uniref:Uncharacterized protein n=1 Tax=Marinomonas arctica TaxID=383750 RepID=A0A7H1J4Z3_9GAMM|nr:MULTISPECIES: hypothetical protein [Marinomonas]MCS7486277.1 hypothetical protein [Marinomonas sp. BSi20414]QNT05559.1 hypothetical protein IBG28_18175 [Marinomonas arctica]GGN30241.1 hypothetical protein GCM10011350_23020 [Marinomonas arctica]